MDVVIGFLCQHCGSETVKAACAACGAPIIWNWKDGYHCSACAAMPKAVACAECASVTPLKQDCRQTRPAEPARREPPSVASDRALWRRPRAAPVPPPPQRWWESVGESMLSGWSVPIALAVVLHAGLFVPLISGREGSQAASLQAHHAAPSALVSVVDSASVAPAALASVLTPRFDIQEPFVPSAPPTQSQLSYDLPEPDGIDTLSKRVALSGLPPVNVAEADGVDVLPKRIALGGLPALDVAEADGIDVLPKRLDPATFQKVAAALVGLPAPDVVEADGVDVLRKRLDPAAFKVAAAALVTQAAYRPAARPQQLAIAVTGPGNGASVLPLDILPIPTPPSPAKAPAVKDPARDAKPAAANPPPITRPAVRRMVTVDMDRAYVPPEDRAYVPPPTRDQPAVARTASARNAYGGFKNPDRLGEVHADGPGATSPAPAAIGIRAYPTGKA